MPFHERHGQKTFQELLEDIQRPLSLGAPAATSSGLNLAATTEQPDLARETARGEAMRTSTAGAAGADAAGGGVPWGQVLMLAGLALKDVLAAKEGKQGTAVVDFALQQGGLRLKEAESKRQERRLQLAEEEGARQKELAPLQQRAALAQITAAQMGNLKTGIDVFDTLSRRSADGTPEQKQAATNEALKMYRGLGLEDIIPERMVRNLMNRPDLLASLTKYKPYLDQLPAGVLQVLRQTKVDDPKELKGLFDTLDHLVGRQAEMDALTTASRAIAGLKTAGKTGPFTSADLQMAFLDKPLAFEKLDTDVVAGRLAPDYVPGKTMLEAQKAGITARALTPEKIAEEAALRPGRVQTELEKQKALQAGRVEIARQTGAAVEAEKEAIRLGRPVPADVLALLGLPKGTTIGAAETGGMKIPEGSELLKLKEMKNFVRQGQNVITELDTLVSKTPEAFGTSGRATALVTGLMAQAQNFARVGGMTIEASLDPKTYAGTFRAIGITSVRLQGNIIALAFPLAVAAQGGGGGRLSDKDVELQIKRIGAAAQDPVAFRAVLADVQQSLGQSLNIAIETATGRAPTVTGGRGATASPQEIEAMPLAALKSLNPRTLNAEQREALKRALTRLGF